MSVTHTRERAIPAALLLAAAAVALPSAAQAPSSGAAVEAAASITAEDIRSRVAFLASDALRGRDTPSPGLDVAAAYLVDQYVRLGLTPGGERGTYYQWYPYPRWQLDRSRTRVRAAAPGGPIDLALGKDFFVSGAAPRDVSGTLAFVGRANPAPAEGSLAGRVAVTVLPGGYTRDWRLERNRLSRAAQRAGASAVIHVLDEAWSADSIARYQEAGNAPQRSLGGPAFPQLFLSRTAAARLFGGGDAVARAWSAAPGARDPLEGVALTLAVPPTELDRAVAPNVIAVLPGSDPRLRNEYVVLSAHMDHVGVGTPVRGDSIYNGADDDASGTSALVEIAEAFVRSGVRPRRSIVFLHVSGEEKGLLGSEWYSDHPTLPLRQTVANINVDMIARNAPDSVVVIGKNYSSLGALVNRVRDRHPELGLVASDDLWPQERFFFRSDHFNFARKEVPSIFFFSGVHPDYHQPSDEVATIDADKAARVARFVYLTAREIADTEQRPTWIAKGLEEVRAMTR